ncbi:MAG: hypothetical protein PF495_18405 [Spirochaetales bacterium]|jgi:hypothetical protein|nr:hypothetical protein [Spirochaetales bacterium]
MVKDELNKRSPLRIFENSIHGGLGKGNLGVIAARHGIGKTACLVHMSTDKLFRDEHVIHISFSRNVNHVITWYEDIFSEIAKKRELSDSVKVHDDIIKNRVIMNFSQVNISVELILQSLKAMIQDGGFKADAIFFDGYKMVDANHDAVERIKDFAKDMNVEVWFSVSPKKDEDTVFDEYGIPFSLGNVDDLVDVLVGLRYNGDHVVMTVVKDHGEKHPVKLALRLDPNTMLISEEN